MQQIQNLQCYLVGGAVRDELLDREVVDRDWVVVGSTPAEMESLGFVQVGRDFPVYLHPRTHDEYALARTERKRGHGHRGFTVDADPSVTLEDDLCRRDLTINAMARNAAGELIDPHNGAADLQNGVLRHVSVAFGEDPLRVFRVARFAAQLPGFTVAEDTQDLMREMVAAGELAELSAERVWQELDKALAASAPLRFFQVLHTCQGLQQWMPEIVLDRLVFNTDNAPMRFAELPLDKEAFKAMANRLRAPSLYLQGALDRVSWAETLLGWRTSEAGSLNDALVALKVLHSTDRLLWLTDLLGMTNGADLRGLLELAQGWSGVSIEGGDLSGKAYGKALRTARLDWLNHERSAPPPLLHL